MNLEYGLMLGIFGCLATFVGFFIAFLVINYNKKKESKMKTEEVVNEDEKKKIETMIKTKKMNGKDLTPEQLQGLDAGLTQGGNPSVLNKNKNKKEKKPYNPYGKGTANPSNMSGSTGP